MKSRTPALDREVLAWTEARWLKVARILGSVMDNPSGRHRRPSLIAGRIQALAKAGRIEGRGDVIQGEARPTAGHPIQRNAAANQMRTPE